MSFCGPWPPPFLPPCACPAPKGSAQSLPHIAVPQGTPTNIYRLRIKRTYCENFPILKIKVRVAGCYAPGSPNR
eukprot:16115872-Heterocapsa_arctica.AAC.1